MSNLVEFNKWEVESQNVTLADEYASKTTFTMPAAEVRIKATFKDKMFTLTVNGGEGSGSYKAGTEVTIKTTITDSQVWQGWTSSSALVNIDKDALEQTIIMPAADVIITANKREKQTFQMTADGNFSYFLDGDITKKSTTNGGKYNILEGRTVYLKGKSYTDQILYKWSSPDVPDLTFSGAGTTSVLSYDSSFVMPSSNVEIWAWYKDVTYPVVIDGGEGSGDYKAGTSVTIKATVPEDSTFFKWELVESNPAFESAVGSGWAEKSSLTFTMTKAIGSIKLKAVFKSIQQITITPARLNLAENTMYPVVLVNGSADPVVVSVGDKVTLQRRSYLHLGISKRATGGWSYKDASMENYASAVKDPFNNTTYTEDTANYWYNAPKWITDQLGMPHGNYIPTWNEIQGLETIELTIREGAVDFEIGTSWVSDIVTLGTTTEDGITVEKVTHQSASQSTSVSVAMNTKLGENYYGTTLSITATTNYPYYEYKITSVAPIGKQFKEWEVQGPATDSLKGWFNKNAIASVNTAYPYFKDYVDEDAIIQQQIVANTLLYKTNVANRSAVAETSNLLYNNGSSVVVDRSCYGIIVIPVFEDLAQGNSLTTFRYEGQTPTELSNNSAVSVQPYEKQYIVSPVPIKSYSWAGTSSNLTCSAYNNTTYGYGVMFNHVNGRSISAKTLTITFADGESWQLSVKGSSL